MKGELFELTFQKYAINEFCSRNSQAIRALLNLKGHGITEDKILQLNTLLENNGYKDIKSYGSKYVLKVTAPCTRCVMITLPQGDLPRDLGILSTVAKYNQVHVGVYASVECGGIIHRGDTPTRRKIKKRNKFYIAPMFNNVFRGQLYLKNVLCI